VASAAAVSPKARIGNNFVPFTPANATAIGTCNARNRDLFLSENAMSFLSKPDSFRRPPPAGTSGAPWRVAGFLVLISVWLSLAGTASAQMGGGDEYQQKAGLICNFLRQCKWPERRFPSTESPYIIGVFGNDQISGFLRENIQGRVIQGRPVQVKHVMQKAELPFCHLVFISRSERDRLRPILGDLRRENVLTVGETDNFLASGGVIQFVNLGGQVRYQMSLDAARRERIEPGGFVLRMSLPQSAARRTDERRLAESISSP
jgi:hypothetical protein